MSVFHSKLVINQIIPEDDAIYQCQAENELGSVLSMARLIVVMSEDRPSAPRNIQADTVSSSAILLSWERPLFNSDKVIAYSVHYMKAEGEQQRPKSEQEQSCHFFSLIRKINYIEIFCMNEKVKHCTPSTELR